MVILGIDPGIARMGWGLIEVKSAKLKVQSFGCFETSLKETMPERLLAIHTFLQELLSENKPDVVSVEQLFFNTNAKTALIVGHARGIVLLAAAEKNLPVVEYTPLQVKMALTGYGRAEKSQVGNMIKAVLGLSSIPKPDDTADALAVAVTHAMSGKMNALTKR